MPAIAERLDDRVLFAEFDRILKNGLKEVDLQIKIYGLREKIKILRNPNYIPRIPHSSVFFSREEIDQTHRLYKTRF